MVTLYHRKIIKSRQEVLEMRTSKDGKEFNQIAYQNDYKREKYDRMELLLPKGRKEILKKKAKAAGVSMSEYINSLLEKELG